jgi:hypothetical protein
LTIPEIKVFLSLSFISKTITGWVPVAHTYILATQEQRSGGSWFKANLGKQFARPSLEKIHHTHTHTHTHTHRLVRWLKV